MQQDDHAYALPIHTDATLPGNFPGMLCKLNSGCEILVERQSLLHLTSKVVL